RTLAEQEEATGVARAADMVATRGPEGPVVLRFDLLAGDDDQVERPAGRQAPVACRHRDRRPSESIRQRRDLNTAVDVSSRNIPAEHEVPGGDDRLVRRDAGKRQSAYAALRVVRREADGD